jgi:hypothetical protein
MKTFTTLLSLLWSGMRNSPTLIKNLPTIILLLGKIREVCASEPFQDTLKMFFGLFGKDSSEEIEQDSSANKEERQRWRFLRFRNRVEVASNMTDSQAQFFCAQRSTHNNETA